MAPIVKPQVWRVDAKQPNGDWAEIGEWNLISPPRNIALNENFIGHIPGLAVEVRITRIH